MIQDYAANDMTKILGDMVEFDRGHASGYRGYIIKSTGQHLGKSAKEARVNCVKLAPVVAEAKILRERSELAWNVYRAAASFYAENLEDWALQQEVFQLANSAMENAGDTVGPEDTAGLKFGDCMLSTMQTLLSVLDQEGKVATWFRAKGVWA